MPMPYPARIDARNNSYSSTHLLTVFLSSQLALPSGSLSKKDLMSFFSITGECGNLEYTVGHERIPGNWYKLPTGDKYTTPGLSLTWSVTLRNMLPSSTPAGNLGEKDTFTAIDFGSLTKDIFNSADLLKGNNLVCFVLLASLAALLDIAGGTLSSVGSALNSLSDTVTERFASLLCPQLNGIDESEFDVCLGYNKCPNGCTNF